MQQCLLLPSVNETFSSFVSELACASNLHVEGKFKGRWILSNPVVCLQHHLSYTCKVRTLLYGSNGDLLVSLSHLVYKSRHARCDHDEKLRTSCTSRPLSPPPSHVTLYDINLRIHQQIQKFLAADLDTLDIDTLVSAELWAFIKSVTQSISECRGRNVKANQPDTLQHHVKQVRCLFCLCTIMFCTDDRCSVPFHTLITDTIESCGGSTQLIRILNRLGVCSSTDTLTRHIQCKVKEREERGPEQDCARKVSTIISADNIDFQHSYARIFCKEVADMEQLFKQYRPQYVVLHAIAQVTPCRWTHQTNNLSRHSSLDALPQHMVIAHLLVQVISYSTGI